MKQFTRLILLLSKKIKEKIKRSRWHRISKKQEKFLIYYQAFKAYADKLYYVDKYNSKRVQQADTLKNKYLKKINRISNIIEKRYAVKH